MKTTVFKYSDTYINSLEAFLSSLEDYEVIWYEDRLAVFYR